MNEKWVESELDKLNKKFRDTQYYGFVIDSTISDPDECINYTGLAAEMTQSQRKAWAYQHVKPTIVKDREIVYDLMPSDLSKKADGTPSVLDGTDGDVMASFSTLYWSVHSANFVSTTIFDGFEIRLSDHPRTDAVTAHIYDGKICEWVHLGMFNASGDTCNSVWDPTNSVYPIANKTLQQFRTNAQTKGTGYGVETMLVRMMFGALLTFAYGTLDMQSKIGKGNVDWANGTGDYAEEIASQQIPYYNTNILTANGEYGINSGDNDYIDGKTGIMALFVYEPWGGIWEFLDCCKRNKSQLGMAIDNADTWDINTSGMKSTWHVLTVPTSGGYIKTFQNDSYAPFVPKTIGGTSATYACDNYYTDNNNSRCCCAGGRWNLAADAGPWALYADPAAAYSHRNVGARLLGFSTN